MQAATIKTFTHWVASLKCAMLNPFFRRTTQAATCNQSADSVDWSDDLHHAMEQAERNGELVLVNVTDVNCELCERMNLISYCDQKVAEIANDNFRCVVVDAGDKGSGMQFAKNLEIDELPSSVIINPRSNVYVIQSGYLDPKDLVSVLSIGKLLCS